MILQLILWLPPSCCHLSHLSLFLHIYNVIYTSARTSAVLWAWTLHSFLSLRESTPPRHDHPLVASKMQPQKQRKKTGHCPKRPQLKTDEHAL